MKKLKQFLVCVMAILLVTLPCLGISLKSKSNFATASASGKSIEISESVKNNFVDEAMAILDTYKEIKNRVSGSEGEKQAALYISNYLSALNKIEAKNNAHIKNGIQSFSFESVLTNKYENSQNIIFDYYGNKASQRKIVIGTHYDSVAFKEGGVLSKDTLVNSESVAGSGASVAFVLALAKTLPELEIPLNIEFVLFGAGESNNAGSEFYTNGISDEEKENILLMMNFDNIAVGQSVYFYTDEVQNDFSNNLAKLSEDLGLALRRVDTVHLSKKILVEASDIGYNYMHIGMASDNYNFMKRDIKSVNFFAGAYSNGIVVGRNEFEGKNIVAYTENDNLAYINENFGENVISNNMAEAFTLIASKLSQENIVSELEKSAGQNKFFHSIFANKNLPVYLTVVALVAFIVVAMLVHYKLTVKAYHANIEVEFLHSVIKICENKDGDLNLEDADPSTISKILANDIKKDKMIRPSKKDKKDKE